MKRRSTLGGWLAFWIGVANVVGVLADAGAAAKPASSAVPGRAVTTPCGCSCSSTCEPRVVTVGDDHLKMSKLPSTTHKRINRRMVPMKPPPSFQAPAPATAPRRSLLMVVSTCPLFARAPLRRGRHTPRLPSPAAHRAHGRLCAVVVSNGGPTRSSADARARAAQRDSWVLGHFIDMYASIRGRSARARVRPV